MTESTKKYVKTYEQICKEDPDAYTDEDGVWVTSNGRYAHTSGVRWCLGRSLDELKEPECIPDAWIEVKREV